MKLYAIAVMAIEEASGWSVLLNSVVGIKICHSEAEAIGIGHIWAERHHLEKLHYKVSVWQATDDDVITAYEAIEWEEEDTPNGNTTG